MFKTFAVAMICFGIAPSFANSSASLKGIPVGASCDQVKQAVKSLDLVLGVNEAVECERGSYARDARATSSLYESLDVNYKDRRVISVRYVATWIARAPASNRVVEELRRTYGEPSMSSNSAGNNVRPFASAFTALLGPASWQLFVWSPYSASYLPDLTAHEQAGVGGDISADRGVSGTFYRAVVLQSKDKMELVMDLKANSITADLEDEQRSRLRARKAAEDQSRALTF